MAKRLMSGTVWRLAVLILAIGLLAGCSRDALYAHLDEQQANDVVAALLNNGIDAEKVQTSERSSDWQVLIDRRDMPAAVAVLHEAGLPHQSTDNYAQMFKKEGLVSSPLEDKQRFIYAREQELGHTLRQLDGVVDANVYLSIPDKDPMSDKPLSGSASVIIIARPNAGIETRASDIKAAIMSGTDGLTDPNRVTVQFFPRPQVDVNPAALRAAQTNPLLRGDATSWLLIGFAALAVLLAATLLWRNRHTLLGGGPPRSSRRGIADER